MTNPCPRQNQHDCADGYCHPCKSVLCPRVVAAQQASQSAVRLMLTDLIWEQTRERAFSTFAVADAILARFDVKEKQ